MNAYTHIRDAYLRDQPQAAARVLEQMSTEDLVEAVAGVEGVVVATVLDLMSTSAARRLFNVLPNDQQIDVLEAASTRLVLLLIGDLPDEDRDRILGDLPEAMRDELDRVMEFPENTAGRLMDPPFEMIRAGNTVAEVLDLIRQSQLQNRRSFYVVDDENKLVGRVDMQALALASSEQRLRDIMVGLEGSVPLTADRAEIVDLLERFRVDSVPVVDLEGRLIGVVRYRRLFEAIENVATAGLQKMVGASADERALSPASFAVKRRLPWLHINLLTAFLAASVVGLFENLIAQFTALAVLLPVVAGQSGNAGSQALAVTIRGLALREIGTREWRRVLGKETWVGVVDGLALAVTCGLGVFLWSRSVGLTIVIGVAMILSMIAAGIAGALVPIVLTRVGQDPATASSIILTTVTDVAGFFSFLGTATLLSFML